MDRGPAFFYGSNFVWRTINWIISINSWRLMVPTRSWSRRRTIEEWFDCLIWLGKRFVDSVKLGTSFLKQLKPPGEGGHDGAEIGVNWDDRWWLSTVKDAVDGFGGKLGQAWLSLENYWRKYLYWKLQCLIWLLNLKNAWKTYANIFFLFSGTVLEILQEIFRPRKKGI